MAPSTLPTILPSGPFAQTTPIYNYNFSLIYTHAHFLTQSSIVARIESGSEIGNDNWIYWRQSLRNMTAEQRDIDAESP